MKTTGTTESLAEEMIRTVLEAIPNGKAEGRKVVEYRINDLKVQFKPILDHYIRGRQLQFADWVCSEKAQWNACLSGDCPHDKQSECSESLVLDFEKRKVCDE